MNIQNKTLKKEIIDELYSLEATCFTYDYPVPFYKDLVLYPVLMKDYFKFLSGSKCCLLNKNDDPEGVALSHLDYLLKKIREEEQGSLLYAQLRGLIEVTMHIPMGKYCCKCKKIISEAKINSLTTEEKEEYTCECKSTEFEDVVRIITNPITRKQELYIKDILINARQFDRLRQIVIYQNFPDYQDDSWVNAEVRADQMAKQEILSKKSNSGEATIEKKIVCVSTATNYKIAEIYELPMRKFLMLLTTVDDLITYSTTRIGMMTGMVSVKNLEHWIYKTSHGLYGEAVNAQSYVNKIQSANKS